MGWGKKDKDEDGPPMPKECPHTNIVRWEPVEENGKVKFYNGVCVCGIYARTKHA